MNELLLFALGFLLGVVVTVVAVAVIAVRMDRKKKDPKIQK